MCEDLDICNACYIKSSTPKHVHTLIQETLSVNTRRDQQLAADSLRSLVTLMWQHVPNRHALGTITDTASRKIAYMSYRQMGEAVNKLACALIYVCNFPRSSKVIICASNSAQWLLADMACVVAGLVAVPLHNTLISKEVVASVIESVQPIAVFCDEGTQRWFRSSNISKVEEDVLKRRDEDSPDFIRRHDISSCTQLSHRVIAMDRQPVNEGGVRQKATNPEVCPVWAHHTFSDLIHAHIPSNTDTQNLEKSTPLQGSELTSIMFTSGSTGNIHLQMPIF